MTITRVGTNSKYANGWDSAFGGKRSSGKASKPAKKMPSKKKPLAKKSAKRAR